MITEIREALAKLVRLENLVLLVPRESKDLKEKLDPREKRENKARLVKLGPRDQKEPRELRERLEM